MCVCVCVDVFCICIIYLKLFCFRGPPNSAHRKREIITVDTPTKNGVQHIVFRS